MHANCLDFPPLLHHFLLQTILDNIFTDLYLVAILKKTGSASEAGLIAEEVD